MCIVNTSSAVHSRMRSSQHAATQIDLLTLELMCLHVCIGDLRCRHNIEYVLDEKNT